MKRFIKDLCKFKGYMFYSAKAQLKAELADSWLGGLWWILEPTLNMLIYMFVFTVVFQRTTTYVTAFIVIGLTYWRFFHNSVIASITLMKHYRTVLAKVYIPKFILVGALLLVNAFKLLCSYVPIIILLIYYQIPWSFHMLSIIPITLLLMLFTFGICCWCTHIGVYVEDLNKVMKIALQMVFYISGVFYPINQLLSTGVAADLITLNPMALILCEARNSLLYAVPCQWQLLGIYAVLAVLIAVLGVIMIYKSESQYVKVL